MATDVALIVFGRKTEAGQAFVDQHGDVSCADLRLLPWAPTAGRQCSRRENGDSTATQLAVFGQSAGVAAVDEIIADNADSHHRGVIKAMCDNSGRHRADVV